MGKREKPQPVSIVYHPDAEEELSKEPDPDRALVISRVNRLTGKTAVEIMAMLDETGYTKIYQIECSHKRGGLRIIFAWGVGTLWMIGHYVKHNNSEGDRSLGRIAHRAKEVEKRGV